jgi:putative transposase
MAEYMRGSHTIHDIKYHIVWITKYRYEVLTKKTAERLRELLIQGCKSRGITIIEGSIGKEHVHMPVSLDNLSAAYVTARAEAIPDFEKAVQINPNYS